MSEVYPETAEKAPLSPEELARIKRLLAANPETGEQDYIGLLARCIELCGSVAGVFLWRVVYLTGRSSKLEDGWFYKSREEMRQETGQGHREQEKARKILKGEKEYAGRTIEVLEENRPSLRAPTHYRVDLLALAEVLGVDISLALAESPRGAAQEADEGGADPESPRGAAQSPYRAAQSPHGAAESHAPWGDFIETSRENKQVENKTKNSFFQKGADDSLSRAAPQQKGEGEDLETSNDSAQPVESSPPQPPRLSMFDPAEDRKYRDVRNLVFDPERETGKLALQVIYGENDREEDHEKLVGAVGRALGDPLGGMQHRARITQALGELKALEEALSEREEVAS